jgi:hypothetical protein
MVELSSHDSIALMRLVQYDGLPMERRRQIFSEILEDDAKAVGEVVLDPDRYSLAPERVQATVDHFREWRKRNLEMSQIKKGRRSYR